MKPKSTRPKKPSDKEIACQFFDGASMTWLSRKHSIPLLRIEGMVRRYMNIQRLL